MPRVSAGDIVGIDFDNTIIQYDRLFQDVALRRGLITDRSAGDKRAIRELARACPDGDIEWQRIQGEVYGPRIHEARLIAGVKAFFQRCAAAGIRAQIVSHKTEFSAHDATHTNLRQAALAWLTANEAFTSDGLGLRPTDIWFASTRAEKLDRIGALGCRLFVDDLPEVFAEPEFPDAVERILFDPAGTEPARNFRSFRSWAAIEAYVFDD